MRHLTGDIPCLRCCGACSHRARSCLATDPSGLLSCLFIDLQKLAHQRFLSVVGRPSSDWSAGDQAIASRRNFITCRQSRSARALRLINLVNFNYGSLQMESCQMPDVLQCTPITWAVDQTPASSLPLSPAEATDTMDGDLC